jgi:Tfp pilus assembly protein PilP
MTMKRTTRVVAVAILTGAAWGQNPGILERTKSALMGVHQQQATTGNAALQGTAPAKPSGAVASKPAPAPQTVPAVKPVSTPPQAAPKPAQPARPVTISGKSPTAPKAPVTVKAAAAPKAAAKAAPAAPKVAVQAAPAAAAASGKGAGENTAKADKPEDKKYAMTGKRDPFVSPVVNRTMGSGCSTGKKCLDIEQIALHGVVKSDNGMIAVVTNGLNKAYFLRENDPVFNGYVVKITGDSIVFKQNFQDRLGKPFTKDVVKRITTPAV